MKGIKMDEDNITLIETDTLFLTKERDFMYKVIKAENHLRNTVDGEYDKICAYFIVIMIFVIMWGVLFAYL